MPDFGQSQSRGVMDYDRHDDIALAQVEQNVARYGWHLQNVLAHWRGIAYSYTVGLRKSFDHPELAILGLKPSVADLALVRAVQEIRAGKRFSPGDREDGLLTGWPCEFVPVPPEETEQLFPLVASFYSGAPVPVCQIIWPKLQADFPQHGKLVHLPEGG